MLLIAGSPAAVHDHLSPLETLLWSKEACTQILARASLHLGELLSSGALAKFKGSNENATALALKADLARWVRRADTDAVLKFEAAELQEVNEYGEVMNGRRVDLSVEGRRRFEVETMVGSGPMEAFYHQKVFTRVLRNGAHVWLVVPNEAVLWAGPYLADVVHTLGLMGAC